MSHGFDTAAGGPACLAVDAMTPANPVNAAMAATATVNDIMVSMVSNDGMRRHHKR